MHICVFILFKVNSLHECAQTVFCVAALFSHYSYPIDIDIIFRSSTYGPHISPPLLEVIFLVSMIFVVCIRSMSRTHWLCRRSSCHVIAITLSLYHHSSFVRVVNYSFGAHVERAKCLQAPTSTSHPRFVDKNHFMMLH